LSGYIKVGNGATLRYIGTAADSTDRRLELFGAAKIEVPSSDAGVTLSGRISGDSLQKTGAGPLILSGSNTYTGSTTVSAGTLKVSGGNAIPDSSPVNLLGGSLDLGGSNETIGSLSGSGNVSLGSGTLRTFASPYPGFSGIISGSGGLEKLGPGTLFLTGANTFAGALRISEGTVSTTGVATAIPASVPVVLGSAMTSGALEHGQSGISVPNLILNGPLTVSAGGGSLRGNILVAGPLAHWRTQHLCLRFIPAAAAQDFKATKILRVPSTSKPVSC
jgi:autotransporter-associated beta strand protein